MLKYFESNDSAPKIVDVVETTDAFAVGLPIVLVLIGVVESIIGDVASKYKNGTSF